MKWRALGVALAVTALIVAWNALGLDQDLLRARLQDLIGRAGPWGVLVFFACFALGNLLQLPGLMFLAVAVLAFGRLQGTCVALIGSVVATTFSFVTVRRFGGQPLGQIERPLIRTILTHLESRPVLTVAVLRILFIVSPPVNVALALSNIRSRHYLLGSSLGLCLSVVGWCLFMDYTAAHFL